MATVASTIASNLEKKAFERSTSLTRTSAEKVRKNVPQTGNLSVTKFRGKPDDLPKPTTVKDRNQGSSKKTNK